MCFASCPYIIYEASVVNLTAFSMSCQCASKFGNSNFVPFLENSRVSFLEKPSATAGSQTPLCESSIKVDQSVTSELMAVIFFNLFFGGLLLLKQKYAFIRKFLPIFGYIFDVIWLKLKINLINWHN